ncbi:MAG: GatB/YqeY domain-containing protein, partial [bacterium]|nr:GatB/YqeY domain-containing protein [bacterium]
MSIKEQIQEHMKAAMKSKDAARLGCLRMVKGALLMKEKESGSDVSDEDTITVLRGEVRKRRDSLEIFREHGKEDEAVATEAEIAVIEEFLPSQ